MDGCKGQWIIGQVYEQIHVYERNVQNGRIGERMPIGWMDE